MNSTFIFRKSNGSKTDAYRRSDLHGSAARQSKLFMIVDDSRILLNCLKMTAERYLNAEVDAFDSPVKAWQAFRRNPKKYRGIITDFHMPEMTGGDLIQRVRAAFADVPIILMSAEAQPEEVNIDRDLYARFVRKPFDWKQVMSQIVELETARQ
ncbi:MAG: response regulator [Limisphaerales bacterium]